MGYQKFKGAVLGYAIGDALGMANEFTQNKVYGFEDSISKNLLRGQWTDDTQFFILGTQSLLAEREVNSNDIAKRLKRIYVSKELRSVGFNTRSAIENLLNKVSPNESGMTGQNSCGAGGISRLLPYALSFDDLSRSDIKTILKITHNNKQLFKVSSALVNFVYDLKSGSNVSSAVNNIKKAYPSKLRSSFNKYDSRGYAPGLIAASVSSFAKYPTDFNSAVIDSVNKFGDTDTRTSLVGFFSGLYNGIDKIPSHFVNVVEDGSNLLNYAKKLGEFSDEYN